MIDIKAIRAAAEAANLYWPPEAEIRSGRWPAIDKLINAMSPQTVIALLDRLEAAEKDAARYVWWRDTACRNPSHVMRLLTPCIYSVEIDDAIDAAMKDGQK